MMIAMARALVLWLLLPWGGAPQASIRDVDGRAWPLLKPDRGAVHLLVFVNADCPISNRYAPELARVAEAYAGRGVRTFLVYEDPTLDVARVRKHLGEFYQGAALPAVIDRDHAVARGAGATVTPTAVVQTADGRAYRGRIDDLYVSLGNARREPTERTLRLALDAVLAGGKAPRAETQAIGCYIEGVK
jgi:hypothetical protein